ncbi:MAG: histidinol dehydrogenase [Candidatus Diapherotrites archaeon]|uniref:Histidinol dehydrogenase n=1 Tax=Candidatus Iainarchaeum sp. TaxID=3101447 RepID=A0A8T4L9B6_9ARCH|nr:histidinol dehydrogenase [Candidatus Diapherotrites archaeon]
MAGVSRTDYERLVKPKAEANRAAEPAAREILEAVRRRGDAALREFTRRFDRVTLSANELEVGAAEKRAALRGLTKEQRSALKCATKNLADFQRAALPKSWAKGFGNGIYAGQTVRPIERVGVYVPAGRYPLPSTALMNLVPAQVAGVREKIVCTPPRKDGKANPLIVAACLLAGADRIFKVGGAQAIAAMAYGTESIPRVDKVFGPGNAYVTAAKRLVYGEVGIDLLAGPTELLVLAKSGNPEWMAADLLASAEHEPNARSVLVTTSRKLARQVEKELKQQLGELATGQVARQSLKRNGLIVLAKNEAQVLRFANDFAAEHAEVWGFGQRFVDGLVNAGTVFLGPWSPKAAGDYASGTNHVLPTGRAARFSSGLSVLEFMRFQNVERLSRRGLEALRPAVACLAREEGLDAHRKSVEKRFEVKRK